MQHTLRDFIDELDRAGELTRITRRVSPVLEIAALADAETKKPAANMPSESAQRLDPRFAGLGGHALLFEHVEGSDIPVLINALGSYRRMEMAIGCEGGGFEAIAAKIAALTKPEPPSSLRDLIAKAKQFAPLLKIPPKKAKRAACQDVMRTGDEIDLTRLPLIKCWEKDGDLASVGYPADANAGVAEADLANDPNYQGRYVTFAGIHTIHADDAGKAKPPSHNIGMYRVQLIGKRHMAMHWHMHHDGARHWRSWKKRGERMPIAIVFGGESVLPFSAIAPLPPGISELLFAGFLNGKGIRMAPGVTVPVRVPANAEIVIEGYVSHEAGMPGWDPRDDDAGELGPGAFFEGPFGDHTGFYSLPDRYPIVEVTAITMREKAVFPATVVGLPPQEDYFMGKAVERLFLPLFKTIVPDVIDYDLPLFGCFHNCAVLQVKKEYPLQGRRLMHSVWGAGQMAWTKCVIVVDDDVDVHDTRAVFRAIAEHCDPATDVELTVGPLDILDHASPELGAGSKIGFDATRTWPGEVIEAPKERSAGAGDVGSLAAIDAVKAVEGVREAAFLNGDNRGWLLVSAAEGGDGAAPQIVAAIRDAQSSVRFVVVVGADVDVHNMDETLFHWLANVDPGRDRHDFDGGMLFDARPKKPGHSANEMRIREWPPLLEGKAIGALP